MQPSAPGDLPPQILTVFTRLTNTVEFLLWACPHLDTGNAATVPTLMELILGEGGKHVKSMLDGENVARRAEQGVLLGEVAFL